MSSPDILFKGIPRGPTRGYTSKVLAAVLPGKVVIPCTGSFSLAWVARESGVPAADIVAGDISLYSTALGRAIMDVDWRLELRDDAPEQLADVVRPYMTDPLSKAAAVMLAIRVLQYVRKDDRAFMRQRRRELTENAQLYIEQLKAQIIQMSEGLAGIRYVAQDMWVTMATERGGRQHREPHQPAALYRRVRAHVRRHRLSV